MCSGDICEWVATAELSCLFFTDTVWIEAFHSQLFFFHFKDKIADMVSSSALCLVTNITTVHAESNKNSIMYQELMQIFHMEYLHDENTLSK